MSLATFEAFLRTRSAIRWRFVEVNKKSTQRISQRISPTDPSSSAFLLVLYIFQCLGWNRLLWLKFEGFNPVDPRTCERARENKAAAILT